jgi:F0F1-type ATP synthase membrane subunit b/b'
MEGHGGGEFIRTLVFTSINFILYLFILVKFVFPKLKGSVEKSKSEMLVELEASKKRLEEAKQIYNRALEKRKSAEQEKEKIKSEIEELTEKECERIRNSAEIYSKNKIEEINRIIEMRVQEKRKELEKYAFQLVLKLAEEKILRVKTKEDEERFLSLALSKIRDLKSSDRN